MPDLDLVVEGDHLERLTRAGAIPALSELIWNSLDAEATDIRIDVDPSDLAGDEGVGTILIIDNGHGIAPDETESTFGHLGGSWKASSERSRNGLVVLHGRAGQGRFRALALGSYVEWLSVTQGESGGQRTKLRILRDNLKRCNVDASVPTDEPIGTTVTIRNPSRAAQSLLDDDAVRAKLTAIFAIRLLESPDLKISYRGVALDPRSVQSDFQHFDLDVPEVGEEPIALDVIEWTVDVDRALHLCDTEGFSLHSIPPGIQAPTFNFTAYVKWQGFREFENVLSVGEMSAELAPVIHAAQDRLREHFRSRAEQRDVEVIRQWKDQGVYPFREGEPEDSTDVAGRDVFDLVALTVNASSPGFVRSDTDSKKVTLRLLREAVERSPESVHKILQEVTKLDTDRLQELAELLENTPLSRVISATRRVTDRLDFLHALDLLLFDLTDEVTERDHLHRILETELWMFGDHFESAISERGLTNALREHLTILERDELVSEPVRLDNGKLARVDLMLSAKIPGRGSRKAEHLVVELKAPSKTLTTAEVGQLEEYATALLGDNRFHNDQTYWEFWLLGNALDATVKRRQTQPDRQPGLIDFGDNYRVWVFEWSQILEEHRRRLLFMREALEHEASDEAAVAYLRRTHEKYLPITLSAS